MLVKIDFYKETGKWYAGEFVEIEPLPWERGIRQSVIDNQRALNDSWIGTYFVVISDHPVSIEDPNYRMIYSRLYKPEDFKGMTKSEVK